MISLTEELHLRQLISEASSKPVHVLSQTSRSSLYDVGQLLRPHADSSSLTMITRPIAKYMSCQLHQCRSHMLRDEFEAGGLKYAQSGDN